MLSTPRVVTRSKDGRLLACFIESGGQAEAITHASHRVDQFDPVGLVDFLAQAVDIDLDQVRLCVKSVRPNIFYDNRTSYRFRRARQKQLQEREFFCSQRNRLPRARHQSLLPVELQIGALQLLASAAPR